MKAALAVTFLLFLQSALALDASMSLNVVAARASLDASTSYSSQQVFGTSTLFTCTYADTRGNSLQNTTCYLMMDGRTNRAVPAGGSHTYGEVLSVGQHAWYCSCFAPGYEVKESDPRSLTILPAPVSDSAKLEVSGEIEQASRALADAKQSGADTSDAEARLNAAKSALDKGDYRLANTLASTSLFGNAFNARDRITDLGLLLVPTLFFGVLVVVVLFLLLRK
ncbi:MAG: hypothetical protein WC759_02215 [Candidatus Micrarchaeia archaeon]|jgi:hypothetical protein